MSERVPHGFRFAGVAAGIKKSGAWTWRWSSATGPAMRLLCSHAMHSRRASPIRPRPADRATSRIAWRSDQPARKCMHGEGGLRCSCDYAGAEAAAGLPPRSCVVRSTGVIGPRLPMAKITAGLAAAAAQLAPDGWDAASRAIMTTDTRPKVAFRQVDGIRLFGMAKGAGMIHPNMATLLATVVTDAEIAPDALDAMLRKAVAASFNSISIDGDTSTNDTLLVLADGAAGPVNADRFADALTDLCADLARQIVRDGEGATKFITVTVQGAASDEDARRAAKAVANSPLVKTAFYGGDANWGRILAAVGYPAMVDLRGLVDRGERGKLQLVVAAARLISEELATAIFQATEIRVTVELGLAAAATVRTCDLSHAAWTSTGATI